MTFENTAVALAETASQSLRALDQHGPQRRPHGADRFAWSVDVLDELARAAELLGRAVEQTTGVPDPDVARRARELATAVVAHRNAVMCQERRAGGGERPFRRDGARPGGTVVPVRIRHGAPSRTGDRGRAVGRTGETLGRRTVHSVLRSDQPRPDR